MVLILGEILVDLKINLIMKSLLIDHAHILFISNAIGKIAKPGAVSPRARITTFPTAKSNVQQL